MKKILSVLLAITMVMTSTVFAAPSVVGTLETADEVLVGEEGGSDMSLSADTTLARGINLFTGTKDAFDGDTYSDFSSWLKQGTAGLLEMAAVTADPTGVRDKVLNLTLPAGCSTGYPNFRIDFGGDLDTDIGHTYVYLAFDYQKYVADTSGFVENKAYWWLNTYGTSSDFAPINHDLVANEGWLHFGKVMDFSVNSGGNRIDDTETNQYYSGQDINKSIVLQFGLNQDNTVPVNVLFDNMVFAPAYKVTYYDKAGNEVVNEEYVVVDEEGNLLSSFTPKTLLAGGKAYGGWATSVGGAPVSEVALTENADIELYATSEADVFGTAKVVLDKKLTKKGDTATATAVFTTDVDFDPAKVTWTVADKNVAIVNYDSDKAIATVTAMGAGTTDITFDYNGESFTDTVTVADGPVVATSVTSGNTISEFAGLDLDVYEYITFNVTNTSGSDKVLNVKLDENNSGNEIDINFASYDVTVPAGASGMDVYLDLSDEDYWTGTAGDIKATVTGVTINNAKLWAELNTENGIDLAADVNLLTEAGASVTVTASNASDLEGVYGEDITLTVDVDSSVASYAVSGNTVTITAKTGKGVATITAVNDEDPSVTATKEILISVIEGKAIGYKWDFNDASNTGFSLSQRYTASAFNGSTANVVAAVATLPDGTEPVAVELSKGTVGGKSVTIVKQTTYGTMSTIDSKVPSGLSIEEYPYLVIKARASSKHSHKLGIYMGYTNHGYDESVRKLVPDVTFTEDFELHVIDASVSAATAPGEYFTGMMFSTNQNSVISSEIKTSGSTYYIEGDVQYDPYYNIEIDEMYFANYDPNKINYGVSLKADKTSLSGDGVITLYPEVFADGEVANDGVNYTVDKEGIVSLLKNSDGTATVTPLRDGTVTITASSIMDETATASITLTFSNIPTRTVAYDLKLMLIGNSYLEHGYLATADKTLYNGYMDKNDIPRGMAATSPELDYYSQLCKRLEAGFEGTFTSKKQGGAVIEQAWKKGLASGSPSNLAGWDSAKSLEAMKVQWAPILDYMDREQPNLITIQLAENAAHAYEESATFFYDELFKVIDEHRPENSIVVIISPMGTNASSRVQPVVGAKYGFYWADNTWIGDDYGWGADNVYLAFEEYPDYTNFEVVEFRTHPGNEGMEEIAKSAYAIFEKYIPTTIKPELVTVPSALEITGNDTITTAGGTAKLYTKVTPESATPKVIWSVDNENLATVDETGLVTALLNGTVTVTAKSAYDETVTDTHVITITGQTQHYTLTYAAGADDTVTGLPESFEYASGNYTFPALIAPPERNGYKFLGWSESVSGTVVESVEMTSAKTVYAVWEFADNWTFNKNGDLEGIMVAGFNTKVEDGVMSTISYDGIAVGFSDNTLLLNADVYTSFKTNISMSTVNAGDIFTLTLTTTEGVKTYTTDTLVGANDYTFDISDAEGMITGFSLYTSNDADGVGMTVDYAKFIKTALKEDVTKETLNVSTDTVLEAENILYTINNVNFTNDASLHLGAGTYVIGNISGAVNITASENANVIITGSVKPEGYIEINVGTKTGARYAEVNGNQYEIKEPSDNAIYGVIVSGKNLLVEIIETGAAALAADGSDTVSRYFYVDAANETYKELGMGNYMYNDDTQDLRVPDEKTENKPGIRFKAYVVPESKNATDYKITEYGYIIGLEETLLNNGEQLNFEASKYVSGKAYVYGEFDKVFDSTSDTAHKFAGVLYGAPVDQYGKRIVAKTYTKVTVDDEEFVLYGEPMVESFYSIAKSLEGDTSLSAEAQAIVADIIAKGEDFGDSDIGLPGDDLWG